METSSACFSRLTSSPCFFLFPPFADQSHLDFYHHRPSLLPSLRSSPSRSFFLPAPSSSREPSPSSLRALCESSFAPPVPDPASDQASLMKELAALKLQMKQKKKELKSQKKDEKKRLKLIMKEGKKTQKDGSVEGKKKKKEQCESSSSSESSCDECQSSSMSMLRQEQSLICGSEDLPARVPSELISTIGREGTCVGVCNASSTEAICAAKDDVAGISFRENKVNFDGDVGSTCRELPVADDTHTRMVPSSTRCLGLNSPFPQAPNRIEVCTGGKCKKAGSEQILSALAVQIPSSSNVQAVPCKCMGKCSMTVNVKVHKEDTNPQHHSHVRVDDATLILSHHFGLGRPLTGLPFLPSQDLTRTPSTTHV